MKTTAFAGFHYGAALGQKFFGVGNPFGCDVSVDRGSGSILKNLAQMGTAQEKVFRQIFNRQFLGQISIYVR